VIVLDENIVDGQRLLLEGWNVTARQVGLDVGRKGLKDEVLLGRLRLACWARRLTARGSYSRGST
jgi:hypothetical protein